MRRRLTNEEKRRYRITLGPTGQWCGTCPDCGTVVMQDGSQAGIVGVLQHTDCPDHRVDGITAAAVRRATL